MIANIAWLDELGVGDVATVGGRAANLGELASAGFPVPPALVATAACYLNAMEAGGVRQELRAGFATSTSPRWRTAPSFAERRLPLDAVRSGDPGARLQPQRRERSSR